MTTQPQDQTRRELTDLAARAVVSRDFAGARALLRRALDLDQGDPSDWLKLAGCCRALGETDSALDALDGALRLDPRNFTALLMRASLIERQGRNKKAAAAYGVALTQAPPDWTLDASTLKAVQHARDVNRNHATELQAFVTREISEQVGARATAETRRADAFLRMTIGKRRRYRQEPAEFFYPGLPAIEFYERDEFPWLETFEAATEAIREELVTALREDADRFVPYIAYSDTVPLDQWANLNHSSRWGALHLIDKGLRVEENCRRCPETLRAIEALPQPCIANRSPAAMFSALQPRTRIPPHTGVANTRLVVHLPLIVPPGCGFRVGGETREWRAGEAWVFDDTIEHEAWNDSDQVRGILICDIWNPRISESERELIVRIIRAMDTFNQSEPASGI